MKWAFLAMGILFELGGSTCMKLSKGFTIGRTNLRLLATVVNATSEESAEGWTENPFRSQGWGAPTRYQQPRRYEVGLRLEF